MTMKKTELEKRQGLKITNALRRTAHMAALPPGDRRAQRERDRAAGLVPFAIKLPGPLVQRLHDAARTQNLPLNELVDRLLRAALDRTEEAR
jgi:hypothetical protein